MGLWVAGLLAVVGTAVLGGGLDGRPASSARPGEALRTADPTTPPVADLVGRVIVLREPPRDGAVVSTRDLVVSGHVPAGTGPVRIGLGSSTGKALAFATVEPEVGDGTTHAFTVGLPLSNPRPGGTMTIQVIAYDLAGVPIDVVRRTFRVGPIERTVGGEDGLIGGLFTD